ncbi:MAG: hypothetical protein JWN67_4136 [Actinomycetia bacterium]|nr:hypothetical protein [Actinomycetes bacterium]
MVLVDAAELVLSSLVGGVVAFGGTRVLNRHQERREYVRTIFLSDIPILRRSIRDALDSPTDLPLLSALRRAAEECDRRAVMVGGWTAGMASQIWLDSFDYENALQWAHDGRSYRSDERVLSPDEEAADSRWHLDQIDDCLDELEAEVHHLLAPQRSARAIRRRARERTKRALYSWRRHRDSRRRALQARRRHMLRV